MSTSNSPEPTQTPEGPTFEGRLLDRPDEDVVDQGPAFDIRTLMTRRTVLGVGAVGVGAVALAACSDGSSSSAATTSASTSADRCLRTGGLSMGGRIPTRRRSR